jgi:hypothetical protein
VLDNDIIQMLAWLGVNEAQLRRRLVVRFSFDPSLYTVHHYGPKRPPNTEHYTDYKRPTREGLASAVAAELGRMGARRVRNKVLIGAVVKRALVTYPLVEDFVRKMEPIEKAEERREVEHHSRRGWWSRHGKKNRWCQG